MALVGKATHVLHGVCQSDPKKQFGGKLTIALVVRIEGCNSPFMKVESLVIVNQHVTVNGGEPCTHRPSRQGRSIGWMLYDGP